jgi:uncharacterized protein (UPF0335 family)
MSATKQQLTDFYEGLLAREEEIAGIRDEIKEGIEAFATNTETDKKALKEGFKVFKRLREDRQNAEAEEFLRDKVVDILISEEDGQA